MSLILDALRKSDRQRNRAASEQLRWAPGPARGEFRGRLPTTLATVLAATLTTALVLAIAGAAGAWMGNRLASMANIPEHGNQIMENTTSVDTLRPTAGEVRSLSGELATRRDETTVVTQTMEDDLPEQPARPESPAVDDTFLHAPALSQLPEEYRAGLPALTINVHAWAEQPGERFILINMQRYAEGERLREGPLVRRITPDGVVLEYRGEIFSLSQR